VSDFGERFEEMLGRELTDKEKQELLRMSKTLGIADNDALWTVVSLLYAYNDKYLAIPEQIERAAMAAAQSSAAQSQRYIDESVSLLVPTIKSEIRRAVKEVVGRVQLGESLWTISLAVLMVGMFGAVCFLLGSKTYGMFQERKISAVDFWERTKWAIAWGYSVPALLTSGYLVLKLDDYEWRNLGIFLIGFGVLVAGLLPLKIFGVIH
jgi:hypothetical protein